MKNYPILTFLQRTWMLLLVFFATNWLCLTEVHFRFLGKWVLDPELGGIWAPATPMEFCGPLLWSIPYVLDTYLLTLFTIHLHFRETIDADINNGNFVTWWKAASFELKVKLVFAAIIGIGLVYGILLAGLARA